MRFRPEQHLRRQSDFRAIRDLGRRINCGAFTLAYLRRETAGVTNLPRVGIVASTASVGHAVLRNRARRRLRDLFRRHQAIIPVGCDLLLTARTATTLWSMPELEKKFVDACQQIAPSKNV